MVQEKQTRVIVVGAAWYGDWAKGFYKAFLRLGYDAEIVYNNSAPAPLGGNKDSVTSLFENSKIFLRKTSPNLFAFLKKRRQRIAEREILVRLKRFDLTKEEAIVIFIWTPGSDWVLRKLKKIKGVRLVLWLGEPVVRDSSWEPKFDYFEEIFIVDDGLWVDVLSEKNKKRAKLLPLSSDDAIFYPMLETPSKYDADVVFVGKYIESRARSLERIKDYNLKIYGYGWEAGFDKFPWLKSKCGGGVPTSELNLIYNGAKIAIGTLGTPKNPFTTATMRTFDIALTGTFQVCEEVYLTKKLFGDSVGFFNNDDDLERLIKYYFDHELECSTQADLSREIALRWTYVENAKKVLRAFDKNI